MTRWLAATVDEAATRWLLAVLLLLALAVAATSEAAIPASERQVLIDLYNATNGAAWTQRTNWRNGTDTDFNDPGTECTWYGLSCGNGGTTVWELYLDANNLVGSLPASLGSLTNLRGLHLGGNKFTGSIPSFLGSLTNLQWLLLGSNQFTGSIPAWLGSLTDLINLDLAANQLTGSIATSLENLTNLQPNSGINLNWNALYSTDATLTAFLYAKHWAGFDWQSTQTVAPKGVATGATTDTSVALSWTPIAYTGDTGGYRAFYSTTPGGPYTSDGITADKSASSIVVSGLNPGTLYFFVVRTVTNPHTFNKNTVTSDPSTEFYAVTTGTTCVFPSAPTAAFTYNPAQPIAGQNIQFTDLSLGGPTEWAWNFGFNGSTSNLQNPTFTYTSAGTYTVTLTATNCKGSSTLQLPIVVLSSCTATVAPVADFSWAPTGPMPGFPEQQQPYVGQQVTFTDHSTNNPFSWHWYDFQEGMVDQTVTTPTFRYSWTRPGYKNVRMTATNCFGTSAEVLKTVQVYDDVRHVIADFSWSPSNVSTGAQVTFTAAQGAAFGNPTVFNWTFDDGSTQTGASVAYSFECGGSRRVTLTAARGGYTGTVSKSVPVSGTSCGPESVMGVDLAKLQGLNDTNWHADVRIYNPSAFPASITFQFLPVGQNNVFPFTVGPYQPPLAPKMTLVLDDILQWVKDNFGQDYSKTALRVTYRTDDNVAPVMTIRTYNLRPDGSKYGQINAGVNVVPGSTRSPQWLTGLRNNGLTDGFRTNYSIVNLRGDAGGVSGITFTLFDETGQNLGSKTFGLAAFGYIQDSIKNLFGGAFESIGTFSLKIEVPAGEDVQTYASVMDNKTGDPVMISATTPPDSPVYLPAMAHLSGEANTVWRSDLQLTNPHGNAPHAWEIRYTPKGTGFPTVVRNTTLAQDKSVFIDDLVSWAYNGLLPADAQTSGIVRIAPVDGTNAYPIVAARSYNLTATGTFGQGIAPLWAAKGVSAPDTTRLVLTGMSSEDIARTNLGFVNLSETQYVGFVVYFYDENGHILNPPGTDGQPRPYTFEISAGTWDQDKLENRFSNAFKVALPTGLRAITAEIRVSYGGPGFAYATVIDTLTGDPNFIPGQLVP